MYSQIDLRGKQFGKLTAILPTDKRSFGKIVWECLCDCGNTCFVQSTKLSTGHTKSCGCWSKEKTTMMNLTHGGTGSRLYVIWRSMKTRCLNAKSKSYGYYGGRGISISEDWIQNFEAFRDWALINGYSEKLTLDRIDCDGMYEPKNCRWATWHEQMMNRRRRVI